MSITLKEFSQFIVDFVNKNFIPLLQTGNLEHQKCLEHWRQVTDAITDIQKMSYWNLESCLKNITNPTASLESKQVKEFKKGDNNRPSTSNYKPYENFFDRKDSTITSYNIEDNSKVNSSLKSTSKDHSQSRNKSFKYNSPINSYETKNAFESKGSNQKTQAISDPQGFERLIQSFRKLCSNFENNHKKLLRQDQNCKQNFKQQFINH